MNKITGQRSCPWCGRKLIGAGRLCLACQKKHLANCRKRQEHEPTEAEIEALIETQRQNLPAWWEKEEARLREIEG